MANPQTPATESCTASTTITIDSTDGSSQEATLQLKLRKPSGERKVKWTTETVDNEHMDKKKSKCCCIYKKPRAFGESSSEDESDDNDHCDHHGQNKKKKCDKAGNESGDNEDVGDSVEIKAN